MSTAVAFLVGAVVGGLAVGGIVYKIKDKQVKNLQKVIDDNNQNQFEKMFQDMNLKNSNVKCYIS